MKTKLLRKLRKIHTIEYFPSTKLYKVRSDEHSRYFVKESTAKFQRNSNMITHGRRDYEKYAKRVLV